jgi:hypothetical protein
MLLLLWLFHVFCCVVVFGVVLDDDNLGAAGSEGK